MSPSDPRIACICGDTSECRARFGGVPVIDATNEAARTVLAADVLIADDRAGAPAAEVLRAVRHDPRFDASLVLVIEGGDPVARALADGVLAGRDAALAQLATIRERAGAFARGRAPHDAEERLLFLLWTRPDAQLYPVCDWRSAAYYRYPLLEALAQPELASESWIARLLSRRLVEPVRFVDRVRLCPSCRSAHQNFVEICPECGEADVAQRPALHCFTCGHVATQERFRREGVLVCPNCETLLRHIGSDYDRPLENWSCNACRRLFVEPNVRARCMACGARHETSALVARDIAAYGLSEHGRLRARSGEVGDLYLPLERVNHVPPEYFVHAVDWMLRVVRRHEDVSFALIGLRLVNVPDLVARRGHARTLALMDALADRLLETVRTTDLCTRTSEEQFWILLPQIDPAGVARLEERLASLLALSGAADEDRLAARRVRYLSSEGGDETEGGEDLLARLASGLA